MEATKKIIPQKFFTCYEMRSTDAKEFSCDIKNLISQYKVVKLVPGYHIENLRDFYNRLTYELGSPVMLAEDWSQQGKMTGEKWMEIRYDESVPDLKAFRHSKNAQPLHTDESYKTEPSDLMVFYCENKAEHGGETVFVNGQELVDRMRIVAPDLLEAVSTTKLAYEKSGSIREEKIISLDSEKPPLFNFNYFCLDSNESPEGKELNQAFFNFLETHVKGSYLEKAVTLRPGEGIIWWDHYVLHGRRPFQAMKTDDRCIWKTAVIL